MEKRNIIADKTIEFSLEIINLYKELVQKKEYVMSKQLLRSATSIGAMVSEAKHAESKMDFVHKLAIAQKEASETEYWLMLLKSSEYIETRKHQRCIEDLEEIQKILSSIIITTKRKLNCER